MVVKLKRIVAGTLRRSCSSVRLFCLHRAPTERRILMRGRSVYGQQASFVRRYKVGRTLYNLPPARAAQFALRTLHDEEPPGTFDSVRSSLDMVSEASDSPQAAHEMKTSVILGFTPAPGSRKSVNWAPQFNHLEKEKKPTIKRCTRLSSQGAASSKPDSEPAEVEKLSEAKIQSTEDSCHDDMPVRVISYKSSRAKKKQVGTPAARLKNPKKERRGQSRARPYFNLRNRVGANVEQDKRVGEKGHREEGKEMGKRLRKVWVSVPLSDMEGGENTTENTPRKCRRVCPEANQSCKRFLDSETVKSETLKIEVDRKAAISSISEVCEKLLQKKDRVEIDDGTLEELRVLVTAVKGVMCKVEHVVQTLEEGKVQRKGKEKAEKEATAAAEQQKLWDEIAKLKLRNQTLAAEKLRILRERNTLKKEHLRMLERARDGSRLQIDRDKAEAVAAALSTELAKEQDKSSCQICFTVPRDAIVLPCMHFQYCNECLQKHQRRSTDCPTCRGKISGVLRCNLFTN